MMKKMTTFLLTTLLTVFSISSIAQCIPAGVQPVFGTVTGITGTQTFTNVPTGNVVRITAPAVGTFYTISMCPTNAGVAQADGIDDSQLTMLDVNSAAAVSVGFNDDFCPTTGTSGFGPSELNYTATAIGDVFVYLTEWAPSGCTADGVNSSYIMTVTITSIAPPCDAGVIVTVGSPFTVCPTDSFTVATDGTETTPANYGILFSPLAGATGGTGAAITLTQIASFPYTANSDLNGVLSGQSTPLPLLSGNWSMRTRAVDGSGGYCSTSVDSIIVNFVPFTDPSCGPAPACNNGDVLAALNGTIQNICVGDSVQLATDGNEVVNAGEIYGWFFQSNTMIDSFYFATGVTNYFGDLNAALGVNAIPYDSYTVSGFATDSGSTVFCGGVLTVGNFTVNFLAPSDPLCSVTPPTGTPCTSATGPFGELNNAGGAPCDDGTGCTPTAVTFGAWASESYLLDNVQSGFDYVFDICSGNGAGAWIPALTIIAPSGAVDAFNLGATGTFAMNCSLAWTATESGTYTIFIHEAGMGCLAGNAIDNGTPTVTCGPNPATCLPPAPCVAGVLTSPSVMTICSNSNDSIVLDGTESTPGSYTVVFSDAPGGTGGLTGGFSIINVNSFPFTFDNDIEGILSSNGYGVLQGMWDITVYNFDASGIICDSIATTISVNFVDSTNVLCGNTAPCSISDISAGSQTPCVNTTNMYTQEVIVTYANAPTTGFLTVNGQNFAIGTSPQTVTLIGLNSDGAAVNVTTSFTTQTSCDYTENGVFNAAVSCLCPTINVNVTTTNVTNCASPDGSATAVATGGVGTYTYTWAPLGSGAIISNIPTGTYTVIATDANGCMGTGINTVNNSSGFSAILDGIPTNVSCYNGNNGVINTQVIGGGINLSYLWSDQTSATNVGDRSNLGAGTYSVLITDVSSSCTYSLGPIEITQPDQLIAVVDNSSDVSCNGANDGSIHVTVTGGNGNNSYVWTNGGGNNEDASSLDNGSYALTVTDAGCPSVTTSTVMITEPDAININIDNQNDVTCFGDNNGNILVTTTGGNGALSFDWDNASDVEDAQNLSGGTYQLTVTDAAGCPSVSSTVININEPVEIVVSIYDFTDVTCFDANDGTITASVVGGIGAINISWTNSTSTSLAPTSLAASSYQLTVTDANMCSVTSAIVTIADAAILTATSSSTAESASGNDGTASVVVAGGSGSYTYLWNPTGQTTSAASGLSAGSYTCTIEDENDCIYTVTVEVAQAIAIGEIALNELVIYPNPSNGTFTVSFETSESLDFEISMINTIGKEVYSNSFINVNGIFTEQIVVQDLSSGIYFLEISNRDAKSVNKITISK